LLLECLLFVSLYFVMDSVRKLLIVPRIY